MDKCSAGRVAQAGLSMLGQLLSPVGKLSCKQAVSAQPGPFLAVRQVSGNPPFFGAAQK